MPQVFTENPFVCRELLGRKVVGQPVQQSQIVDNTFLYSYLEAKQLMILNNMKDLKLATFKNLTKSQEEPQILCPDTKHQLLIVNGTYAAGKARAADYLVRYAKDYRLKAKVFSLESENIYSKIELPAYM